jgi:hypothetical protein
MGNFFGRQAGANVRKIKTLVLSVFLNMWLQLSSLAYSAATVFFVSKEFWGAYSKIIIALSFYVVVCSWGSREFLTTLRAPDFANSVVRNLFKRLVLLVASIILIIITLKTHVLFAVLFLTLKFFNAAMEIIIIKERKFNRVLFFESLFLLSFLLILFSFMIRFM